MQTFLLSAASTFVLGDYFLDFVCDFSSSRQNCKEILEICKMQVAGLALN